MAKGTVVVDDIPVICAECRRASIKGDNLFCEEKQRTIYNAKPDWCPIKPIPQRKDYRGPEALDGMFMSTRARQAIDKAGKIG
ncbi:hypothetical protein H8S37_04200 [Mediterraneibacter sp. NSJ-55]|uniref:Uncharacterized protein n=1 Tax=Mediterraneibacter hominis TaxID=2763054 RepID=A0A923LG74_9FIRM|nr:hypothetical protein [Mediterraneibacter hominis]MBC5688135.1 hypothetical protein [Mediterraneibacter hominis]